MSLYPVTPLLLGKAMGWAFHTEVSGRTVVRGGKPAPGAIEAQRALQRHAPMVHWSCA